MPSSLVLRFLQFNGSSYTGLLSFAAPTSGERTLGVQPTLKPRPLIAELTSKSLSLFIHKSGITVAHRLGLNKMSVKGLAQDPGQSKARNE